ncbi:SusD/RagB family nutrient-binding outer membrane lipoprotein [Pedobacter sp. MC2016-14]|uniref:SusD/RagB family nutrient-binding outer membrane lipoprotein n=1 Tax=Pedobacter sp. MC2016-14 TaxID=2897327 RepID=UPI001E54B947|nr:SusD/RagB family nutrient-binding outer membrane lipoprotein [Pedobacter sp. MC2016-14]MCD0487393.1 SusD/RagB family nutrient-binding outer membrane lipoprotein [Pedobacter sp. MC2016-14]
MKNTHIYILILVLASSIGLSSCKKYLDINSNPNRAERVEPKLLFSFAAVSFANLRSGGDLNIPFALVGQSMATGGNNPTGWGIPSEEQYVISSFSTGNSWRAYYTTIGSNLKEAIKLAESSSPINNNAAAQSKILLAMSAFETTTVFGDVPFSEAWNTNIAYPKFDTQKQVMEGCIALLDEALAQFDTSSPLKIGMENDEAYDLFYRGDLDKWKRLANSVKLRILLTMVDKDPTKAAAIGTLMTAHDFIGSASDNCLIAYQDVSGKKNPKYLISEQYNNNVPFFFGSNKIVDFMNTLGDPRRPKFFDKPAAATNYVGIASGQTAANAVNVRISTSLQTAIEPEVFFSYQEQLFYEAEIYARGIGVATNLATAEGLYRQGVVESCKFYGVSTDDADDFGESLPALAAGTAGVKTIQMHNWVDKMDRGIDAFTQWRRSGSEGNETPVLTLPTGAPAGPLFRRYEYPITNEISTNPNAPKNKIVFTEKMWFDL